MRAAAWSAPVVASVALAPHAAASGGTIVSQFYDVSPSAYNSAGRPTALVGSMSFGNTGTPNVTISTITVTVTLPASRVSGASPTNVTGAGWAYTSTSSGGGTRLFVFTWTGSLPAYGSTSQLNFTVALNNTSPGTVSSTATASASGGNSVSTTVTWSI
ncbi:hypothetical protein [Ornithinibacter aureus]|uniref:hypothetical protein n=1 Tax=Ornithinibacter aureus TaxID=622664 RepID=UPI0013575375|nr:hypothetical protein [Ornithinibacter aureus]